MDNGDAGGLRPERLKDHLGQQMRMKLKPYDLIFTGAWEEKGGSSDCWTFKAYLGADSRNDMGSLTQEVSVNQW